MAPNAASANRQFVSSALRRNYPMPQYKITQAGQVIDIPLDEVPGWAREIDLRVYLDLAIAVGAGGTAPSMSQFAPENFFSRVEVSMGGGPFQAVSPYFYRLRRLATNPGWTQSSASSYSVPAVSAPASATTDNYWQFGIKVPLQVQEGSVIGLLPFGNASVQCKIRLTVQPTLYGTDEYLNPFYGGTNVTSVSVGTAKTSYVQPNIKYFTDPAVGGGLPTPAIGAILNVQERVTPLSTAGSNIPIKFPDPFQYMRLWHVVINGNGAPDSTDVTNFELDLTPGYPKEIFNTPDALNDYLDQMAELYRNNLPTGVYVFDLVSGSDPKNPNGTQVINGQAFSTLQTQMSVSQSASVGASAKIITYAEALSPVAF